MPSCTPGAKQRVLPCSLSPAFNTQTILTQTHCQATSHSCLLVNSTARWQVLRHHPGRRTCRQLTSAHSAPTTVHPAVSVSVTVSWPNTAGSQANHRQHNLRHAAHALAHSAGSATAAEPSSLTAAEVSSSTAAYSDSVADRSASDSKWWNWRFGSRIHYRQVTVG